MTQETSKSSIAIAILGPGGGWCSFPPALGQRSRASDPVWDRPGGSLGKCRPKWWLSMAKVQTPRGSTSFIPFNPWKSRFKKKSRTPLKIQSKSTSHAATSSTFVRMKNWESGPRSALRSACRSKAMESLVNMKIIGIYCMLIRLKQDIWVLNAVDKFRSISNFPAGRMGPTLAKQNHGGRCWLLTT